MRGAPTHVKFLKKQKQIKIISPVEKVNPGRKEEMLSVWLFKVKSDSFKIVLFLNSYISNERKEVSITW